MNNNREIIISSAGNRFTAIWTKQKLFWTELIEKLKTPVRSTETLEEYLKYPKSKQDNLKDVGGFIGGELIENNRKKGIVSRDIIALDLDNIEPGKTEDVLKKVSSLGCAYAVYSTRKHSNYNPRLRVLIPGNRSLLPDEYEPVARKLASMIGIVLCDPTTFQVTRLMYWPSCSSDSQYVYAYEDKPFADIDGILKMYQDWHNISEWPQVPGSEKTITLLRKKQENPLEKTGIIGAFCRSYSIVEAIEKFIPDAYEIHEGSNRLTYKGGSTFGGAILYEDGLFLYSHHATDPASMKLCNAFDLIRIHKFGELDIEAKEGTPVNKMPSFSKMTEMLLKDQKVKSLMNREKMEKVAEDFADSDLDWMEELDVDGNGNYAKTRNNILLILQNDEQLKGKIAYDEFANRGLVLGSLPWNIEDKKRNWSEIDDAQLRLRLEHVYGITGDGKVSDALLAHAYNNRINDVKEYMVSLKWDGVKRLDTLLIDYFGAEDNVYTRATIRKMLVAAVARTMCAGVKFDTMLILAGPQGIGKSTFLCLLGKEWFSDSLQSFEGKEASEMIQGTLINEIGELTGLSKSEVNAVKQFLSKKEDIYREAYGRKTARFPRRCVFFGSTNEAEFLKDRTGNRRFWPVGLYINKPKKNIFEDLAGEVDQIWAEAVKYWEDGEELFLTGEAKRIAEMEQDNYRESNVKEGLIQEYLSTRLPNNWDSLSISDRRATIESLMKDNNLKDGESFERTKICALEVWCECFRGDPKYMQRRDSIEINGILETLKGWKRSKSLVRFGPYGHQRGFIKAKN
nr:MAG TPA_asm: virulence associated protein E [Caudoviricetes sp.]